MARAALPELTGRIRVDGVSGPVEVLRDGLGVPHVRARSTEDAFFAQGFVHAQDRLWQMELDRMRAAGRAAKLLGRGALTWDIFNRRMGVVAAGRADYESLSAEARAPLQAYAAGVNAFIDSARALPVEFQLLDHTPDPWRPEDCAAALKVRHILMGNFHAKLWRARLLLALGPDAMSVGAAHGREDTLIIPVGAREVFDARPDDLVPGALAAAALGDGSNSWAIHGSRTASGLPLLAGDPHRALEVPNVYYQNHIACDAFDAIGFSMPGIPGLFHFGHNHTVAWSITHAMADTQDLFVDRFDDRGHFELDGKWFPSERSSELVEVRGEAPVRIDLTRTLNGAVIAGDPARGSAITMRWTGTDAPNTSLAVVVPMLRAKSVAELDESMRAWVEPCNSFLMADTAGTIAYLHRGSVPVRARANAWAPVPGWTGEGRWDGEVAFEDLPRLRNPEDGYIATANNRVIGHEYRHYLGMDYAAPHRVDRVLARLEALQSATIDDMAAIHGDRVSLSSEPLLAMVARAKHSARTVAAREMLAVWNRSMDPDAAAPTVFASIREELAGVLEEIDPLARLVHNPFPEEPYATPARARLRSALPRLLAADDTSLLGGRSWEEVVSEAVDRAVTTLERTLGDDPDQWRWERVHRTKSRHPLSGQFPEAAAALNPASLPLGGDGDNVLAGSEETGLGVLHSSVARYAFDLGDLQRSGWVVPLGSSGHAASTHYADQGPTWSNVKLSPMRTDWNLLEGEAETRQTLASR